MVHLLNFTMVPVDIETAAPEADVPPPLITRLLKIMVLPEAAILKTRKAEGEEVTIPASVTPGTGTVMV